MNNTDAASPDRDATTDKSGVTNDELRLLIERDNPAAPLARAMLRHRGHEVEFQDGE
jgi:hypothetical protein